MHLTNFIFTPILFLIPSYQIFKNDTILINHESFFFGKRLSTTLDIFGVLSWLWGPEKM